MINFSAFTQKRKQIDQEIVIVTGKTLSVDDSSRVLQLYYSGLREKVVQNQSLAIDYFNQMLQIDAANENACYELAQIYFKKGDLTNARIFVQRAVTIKTDNEWYWLLAGSIYQQQQDYELLNYTLDELIKIAPDKTDYSFDKANALFMMGKTEESLQLYNSLEKKVGLTDQVLQGRQRIYLKNGNINQAAIDLRQLIANNPSDARYYLYLGDLYYSNDMIVEALSVYQEAKNLDSSNPFTRMAIAQILEAQKKPDEAFEEIKEAFKQSEFNIDQKVKIIIKYFDLFPNPEALQKAKELAKIVSEAHPSDPKSFALYGDILYQNDDLKNAKVAYENALALNKNTYAIWDQLLRIQLYFNDTKGIIANGEEAITLFPNQYELYFYTALAYLQEKKFEPAINYFNLALTFDVENKAAKVQIFSSLGDAYQAQKKYKESVIAFEKALYLDPDNAYTLNNYAYYLSLRNEDLAKAEQMSAKSNRIESENASFQDTYAWILFKLGRYEEAKIWMEKAVVNNPNSAIQFEHLGDIYFKLGDLNNALESWEHALSLDKNNSMVQKKINEKKYFE